MRECACKSVYLHSCVGVKVFTCMYECVSVSLCMDAFMSMCECVRELCACMTEKQPLKPRPRSGEPLPGMGVSGSHGARVRCQVAQWPWCHL